MSNEVKLTVSQSRGYENVDINTISSREVAEMMEMTSKDGHSDLMKKIDKISKTLLSEKIPTVNYWFESSYKDSTGRTLREYQVTKRGCEMLAHKSTGDKGIIFTHKYMERFEQMENHIKQQKDSYMIDDPIERAKRWIEEQQEKQLLAIQNEEMKPKALAYDKFMEADGTYTTTNACKMLGLKRNKVFEFLRENELVYKNKTEATQKAIDKGWFKQVLKNGYPTMVITPKGIDFLQNNFN